MAVQEARPSAHEGGCACGDCPHGAREGHRRAVTRFLALRDELASGRGLPAAVAHSASATRQWVSEELTQSAAEVAERGRAEDLARLGPLWRRTVRLLWTAVGVLLLGQALTALDAGWTAGRTAGLIAACLLAALLSAAAYLHRARGGLLAPLTRADNRLSTTRAVAAAWLLLFGYALLVLTVEVAVADASEGERNLGSLSLGHSAGTVTVLGVLVAVAVLADRAAALRVVRGRLQRVPAARPRGADLLTDESGRGSFTAVQYVCVAGGALVLAGVLLARSPGEIPELPWGLVLAVLVSAGVAAGAACTTGSRPVILSVVRAREAGGLDGPIRTGDDVEIRGTGFVPAGARSADQLARITVRFGAVHAQVPLVPVAGGFANPTDSVLTVPVPVDVEPGRVEVRVVTAAGVETNRCLIDVSD